MSAAAGDRSSAQHRILLLDDYWNGLVQVAAELVRHGCEVHRAGGWLVQRPASRLFTSQTQIRWSDRDFPSRLDALVERVQPDSVFPLSEQAIGALAALAPSWAGRIFPPIEPWQHVLLADKGAMSAHLAANGVAVPISRPAHSDADVERALDELGLPIVVRRRASVGGSGVTIAPDAASARRAVGSYRALDAADPQLQEYVRGSTYLVGGVFRRGEAIRLYAGRKLELWPPDTGPCTVIRSDDSRELRDAALRAFSAVSWTGLASADFMHDPARGFLFLEMNPRPWGSLPAALEAGIDLFGAVTELIRGGRPLADLEFEPNRTAWLFPMYAASRIARDGLVALADPRSWRGLAWRQPLVASDMVRRLGGVVRDHLRRPA